MKSVSLIKFSSLKIYSLIPSTSHQGGMQMIRVEITINCSDVLKAFVQNTIENALKAGGVWDYTFKISNDTMEGQALVDEVDKEVGKTKKDSVKIQNPCVSCGCEVDDPKENVCFTCDSLRG